MTVPQMDNPKNICGNEQEEEQHKSSADFDGSDLSVPLGDSPFAVRTSLLQRRIWKFLMIAERSLLPVFGVYLFIIAHLGCFIKTRDDNRLFSIQRLNINHQVVDFTHNKLVDRISFVIFNFYLFL